MVKHSLLFIFALTVAVVFNTDADNDDSEEVTTKATPVLKGPKVTEKVCFQIKKQET